MIIFTTGRVHRMLIPYPITTSSDGRPIPDTKSRQQKQNQVDQGNQLLPTASNGATGTHTLSHILIPSLPHYCALSNTPSSRLQFLSSQLLGQQRRALVATINEVLVLLPCSLSSLFLHIILRVQ